MMLMNSAEHRMALFPGASNYGCQGGSSHLLRIWDRSPRVCSMFGRVSQVPVLGIYQWICRQGRRCVRSIRGLIDPSEHSEDEADRETTDTPMTLERLRERRRE